MGRHPAAPVLAHAALVDALIRFGQQLHSLPSIMRESGVDPDIVDFLLPSIETQATQLSRLVM
jgi:serine/threonine-protein kinase HipA